MSARQKLKSDLNVLRGEASKVVDDLSRLGNALADVGEVNSKDVKEDVNEFFEKEFAALKKRLEGLDTEIAHMAKAADKHIHANPYLYILGSLGLGFLLGKIRAPRSHE